MKKTAKPRLTIDRDTVRILAVDILQRLRAGMLASQTLSQTSNTCPPSGASDCQCPC